jgi:hypothetical protein
MEMKMRQTLIATILGLSLIIPAAQARPTHHNLHAHPSLCGGKPTELPLADGHQLIAGDVATGAAQCFAFTAAPGTHITLTIDSPSGAAVFQLYQMRWKQVTPHRGARPKWVELIASPDTDSAQTWSGAMPGKSRHVLIVRSNSGTTSFKLAIGIDPLRQDI